MLSFLLRPSFPDRASLLVLLPWQLLLTLVVIIIIIVISYPSSSSWCQVRAAATSLRSSIYTISHHERPQSTSDFPIWQPHAATSGATEALPIFFFLSHAFPHADHPNKQKRCPLSQDNLYKNAILPETVVHCRLLLLRSLFFLSSPPPTVPQQSPRASNTHSLPPWIRDFGKSGVKLGRSFQGSLSTGTQECQPQPKAWLESRRHLPSSPPPLLEGIQRKLTKYDTIGPHGNNYLAHDRPIVDPCSFFFFFLSLVESLVAERQTSTIFPCCITSTRTLISSKAFREKCDETPSFFFFLPHERGGRTKKKKGKPTRERNAKGEKAAWPIISVGSFWSFERERGPVASSHPPPLCPSVFFFPPWSGGTQTSKISAVPFPLQLQRSAALW